MYRTVKSCGNPDFAPNSGANAENSRAQAQCGGQRRTTPRNTCQTCWVVKEPETGKWL